MHLQIYGENIANSNEIKFNIYATTHNTNKPRDGITASKAMTLPINENHLNGIENHHSKNNENGFSKIGFINYKRNGKNIFTDQLYPKIYLCPIWGEGRFQRFGSTIELKILKYFEKQGITQIIGSDTPSNSRLLQQERLGAITLSQKEKLLLEKEPKHSTKLLEEMREDGRLPIRTPIRKMITYLRKYIDSTQ